MYKFENIDWAFNQFSYLHWYLHQQISNYKVTKLQTCFSCSQFHHIVVILKARKEEQKLQIILNAKSLPQLLYSWQCLLLIGFNYYPRSLPIIFDITSHTSALFFTLFTIYKLFVALRSEDFVMKIQDQNDED